MARSHNCTQYSDCPRSRIAAHDSVPQMRKKPVRPRQKRIRIRKGLLRLLGLRPMWRIPRGARSQQTSQGVFTLRPSPENLTDHWEVVHPWWAKFWHCHQQEDRCLNIRGQSMLLCSRCVGLMPGLLIGIAIAWALPSQTRLVVGAFGFTYCLGDWFIQSVWGKWQNNWMRALAGFAGGIGSLALAWHLVHWGARQLLGPIE